MTRTEANASQEFGRPSMATSIISESEPFIILSAELLKIHGRYQAFILYRISKRGEVRDFDERWTPPKHMTEDEIYRTILEKATALLNKSGKVWYTFEGLANVLPRPLGNITFEKLAAEENPTLPLVQAIGKQAFIEAYK